MKLHSLIKIRFCSDAKCDRKCSTCIVTELIETIEPYVEDIDVKDNCL